MLTLDALLDSIDYLPPMPRNLTRLLDLLNRTDVDIGEIVDLIQYDPALTAQVMRACNSAFFGGGAPADDLREATARLGFNEIFQLATALSAAAFMRPAQKGYGIESGELWRHCVTAALVGKLLAIEHEQNACLIFTACILHDIGKVVLSRGLEGRYDQVLDETRNSQGSMLVVERKLLGFDHASVGSRLLERWKFPAELVQAVGFHHDPAAAPEHKRLAAYTYLANAVACFMGYGCGHQALALTARSEALDLTEISSEEIPRCMTRAFYALRDAEALLAFAF